MSLRTVVLAILGISILYALAFVPQIAQTLGELIAFLLQTPEAVILALVSSLLLLCGHVVRAYRDTVLFSKAAKTRVRSQFMAFAVGSLCNAILPLRIGELIRSDVIAQRFSISFSFSFVLICLERLVDIMVLGLLSLVVFGFNVPLAIIGCVIFCMIAMLWSPPKGVKRVLASCGAILNDKAEAKLLFTFWSLEYGLKRTLRFDLMGRYLLISIANWVLYIGSLIPLTLFFYGPQRMLSASIGVFLSLTTSAAPSALGDYTPMLESLGFSGTSELILLWMVAIVPTSLIGLLLALFNLKSLPLLRRKDRPHEGVDLDNKLARNADISADQLGFMKDYYSGKPLAMSVASKEMAGGAAFAKYFTNGGSGAMTYQSKVDDAVCVVKTVALEKSGALRAQYEWLQDHPSPNIVAVVNEEEGLDAYSVAIEYEKSAVDLFDHVHTNPVADGKRLLDEVIRALDRAVWNAGEHSERPVDARERVEAYIQRHLVASMNVAADALPIVRQAQQCRSIMVNGCEYPNLSALMEQLERRAIMDDLCDFRLSNAIHGDLIVDNIIYSQAKQRPIILDPVVNEFNLFEGPVFDFGKLSQSLQIGYEFLLRDTAPIEVDIQDDICTIEYRDGRSSIYEELWQHVQGELAPRYLNSSEMRTMLFLGASNYFRRMKYQAVQFPQNAMKMYAVGIRYLSEYIHLFDGVPDAE